MSKKELRKYFMEIRKSASCKESDALIFQRLKELDVFDNADTVLIFASHRSEPSTWELAEYLLEKGILIAYPKCADEGEMTFFRVKSLEQLHIGKYGIPEPMGSIVDIPQITERTVCIVPGLAFTADGKRLGNGGGYYDRFLSKYPSIMTIAPIYEKCIAEDIPTMEHDIKVKAIVTEERMVICNE